LTNVLSYSYLDALVQMSNCTTVAFGVFIWLAILATVIWSDMPKTGGQQRHSSSASGMPNKERILLSSITAMPLVQGSMTTGRRHAPVPQLVCTGAYCGNYQPNTVLCSNVGTDGTDPVWQCTDPSMPSMFNFGSISVSCEGYSSPVCHTRMHRLMNNSKNLNFFIVFVAE
jgi:hypothetical protein